MLLALNSLNFTILAVSRRLFRFWPRLQASFCQSVSPALVAGRASGYNRRMPIKQKGPRIRSTTVLCVRKDGHVVLAGDGQVTLGEGVVKHNAKKIRRLFSD